MGKKDVTPVGDFHHWYRKGNTPVSFSMSIKKKTSWIWVVFPEGTKDQVILEKTNG